MLLVSSPSGCAGPRVRRVSGIYGAAILAIFFRVQAAFAAARNQASATDISASRPTWAFLVASLVLLGAVMLLAYSLIRAARRQTSKARELAAHLEHERDLAQDALVQKLEQERELSKERMQFESQLTE